jgi:DNA polymerase-3 subunit epsilon
MKSSDGATPPHIPTSNLGYAVIDLETTGLDPNAEHILEIAVVQLNASAEIEHEWSTLVRQPEGRIMVAHNAKFDYGFLDAASRRCGVALPINGPLCTLDLARATTNSQSREMASERSSPAMSSGRTSNKLAVVCERYGVPFESQHRALQDARACAEILPLLLADLGLSHGADFLAGNHR